MDYLWMFTFIMTQKRQASFVATLKDSYPVSAGCGSRRKSLLFYSLQEFQDYVSEMMSWGILSIRKEGCDFADSLFVSEATQSIHTIVFHVRLDGETLLWCRTKVKSCQTRITTVNPHHLDEASAPQKVPICLSKENHHWYRVSYNYDYKQTAVNNNNKKKKVLLR
jgi:hypothetical protein